MTGKIKTLRSLLIVAVVALFLAILPIWSYGFYTLLRLLVCVVCIYFVVQLKILPSLQHHKAPLIMIAILFNPLIPVYLVRTIWLPIGVGVGAYLITLIKKLGALNVVEENNKEN